ncbi:hypothetical protein LLEC1_03597 [Akanthomyces lecanii]|uniref:Uncharacterized protein n=1 Tax=Cordyceps confragosa TaxID=2714763 RepID=A0A179I1R2_CORDF|nr:hypothetical protein LLEC1_03597 [Akanthomyces lecanii]
MVTQLLKRGARLKTKNVNGLTPLRLATSNKMDGIASALASAGAESIENGDEQMVKLLLDFDADAEAQYRSGPTPLAFAENRGFEKIVKLLQGNVKK